MPAEKGSLFLLKIADATSPSGYDTVAGLRSTQMTINGDAIDITTKDSGGWRDLLSGAGVRSVSISAAGVFTGSASEVRLRSAALTGAVESFELTFESGERLQGRFLVTRLDTSGDYNGERVYTLALESSGPVAVVTGAAA